MQSRRVLTAVGEVQFLRPWYLCPQCHSGQVPADVALDVEKTDLSPGVRRMLALVGSETSFDHGRQQIALFAGLEVTTKAVERTAESIGADIAGREQTAVEQALQLHLPIMVGEPIPILYVQMDGTGVPVVRKETVGRVGKVDGQPAYTREVKFGCVFIQTGWDDEGYAIRDPGSTTYTGGIETASQFGSRIYLEAWNRGWNRAEKKVVIGDGAEWIWNHADQHFPGAVQIVDLFHARQHLWELARLLHLGDMPHQKQWMLRHRPKLDDGKIEKLVRFIQGIEVPTPSIAETIRIEAAYFERNVQRMRYPEFRTLALVRRLRRDRSRVQNCHRLPPQTVWYVLDGQRSKCHYRPPLLPSQQPHGNLLGVTSCGLRLHFYVAHPDAGACHRFPGRDWATA